ncbi:FecR domain-containing protein [Pseudomonas sp. nanlin1]|uniref:FecR domain-containing protein n=1 Tax=Pseudomonas sp. nanlin1 TaxID=3040605 RepID=UPI00388E4A20
MKRAAPSTEALQAARAAAQWLALLESGTANEGDYASLQRWRDSSARHEQAWQKAQQLRQRFANLPPALALATLDRSQASRRVVLKRALGLTALVPAAWLLGRQLPLEAWRADLRTATGERRQMTLADGSALQLNTASAVDVDMAQRRITLVEGEVALKVSGTSPLSLETRYGRLSVAQSEVCARLDEDGCRVSVTSGAVGLQPLQGPVLMLRAGQQVSLGSQGAASVQPFDLAQLGWRQGVLVAQDQALGAFLRELSRYRPGLLRWDPALERLRVTGSFRLEDTDRVLHLLAASLPLEVQTRTRFWVSLVPRKDTA